MPEPNGRNSTSVADMPELPGRPASGVANLSELSVGL
jgi:hypothetical protein